MSHLLQIPSSEPHIRYRTLNEEASRLFIQSDTWDVKYLSHSGNKVDAHCCVKELHDLSTLRDILQKDYNRSSTAFFIIRQKDSWSRLQISHPAFLEILSSIGVNPEFAEYVRAFGMKVREFDDDFGGYHRETQEEKHANRHELCYNIRYPSRISRGSEYPWVFRQMAIYQSCCPSVEASSQWIMLQLPTHVEKDILGLFSDSKWHQTVKIPAQAFQINYMILASTEKGWRQYINHMDTEISSLNEKACFSKVGRTAKYDYSVSFDDSQDLQRSRERLLKALSAVEASLEASVGIQAHLRIILDDADKSHALLKLESYHSRMNGHKRALIRLLKVSSGTSKLLLKILDFRNDEAMRINASHTQAILKAACEENETIRTISKKTQVDSRSMKILASIAIAYLPANFVAAMFSTTFIQGVDGSADASARHTQIGYYVLSTCLLTIVTISITWTWERSLLIRLFTATLRTRDC